MPRILLLLLCCVACGGSRFEDPIVEALAAAGFEGAVVPSPPEAVQLSRELEHEAHVCLGVHRGPEHAVLCVHRFRSAAAASRLVGEDVGRTVVQQGAVTAVAYGPARREVVDAVFANQDAGRAILLVRSDLPLSGPSEWRDRPQRAIVARRDPGAQP